MDSRYSREYLEDVAIDMEELAEMEALQVGDGRALISLAREGCCPELDISWDDYDRRYEYYIKCYIDGVIKFGKTPRYTFIGSSFADCAVQIAKKIMEK